MRRCAIFDLSPHAGDVAERGRDLPDRVVWISRDELEVLGLPAELRAGDALPGEIARRGIRDRFVDRAIADGFRVRPPGLAPWMIVYGPRGWRVDLAVPAWDTAGGLEELGDVELRAAVSLFRDTVGVRYRRSPSATGTDLLRELGRRRPLGRSDPPAFAANGALETDLRWIRELRPDELRRPWIHAFDANARYLASCSSVELGAGEPEQITPTRSPTIGFDPRIPGYWRAEIGRARDPLLQATIGEAGGARWITTPTAELADQHELLGPISDAYVWPRHARLLEPFYRRLRDARAALSEPPETPARTAALRLVKRTYAHTIGSFAGHWREPGDPFYRPDWRHAIIALSRVNLYRRVRRIPDPAFAIDVDGVWISSWSEDPRVAGRELGIGDGPGSFRVVGSAPMRALPELADPAVWRRLREIVAPSDQLELAL